MSFDAISRKSRRQECGASVETHTELLPWTRCSSACHTSPLRCSAGQHVAWPGSGGAHERRCRRTDPPSWRRYDVILASSDWSVKDVGYDYRSAVEAGSDHALVSLCAEMRCAAE